MLFFWDSFMLLSVVFYVESDGKGKDSRGFV